MNKLLNGEISQFYKTITDSFSALRETQFTLVFNAFKIRETPKEYRLIFFRFFMHYFQRFLGTYLSFAETVFVNSATYDFI